MSSTTNLYKRFSKFPFGKSLFSRALTFRAPYFASIRPLITELQSGKCRTRIKDRRGVRNHMGTVNAGAMCTLCELTAGLAVDASLPPNLRWIPREMTVRYLRKPSGDLMGVCVFDPAVLSPGDVHVPIEILNKADEKVLAGEIIFYISERKSKIS